MIKLNTLFNEIQLNTKHHLFPVDKLLKLRSKIICTGVKEEEGLDRIDNYFGYDESPYNITSWINGLFEKDSKKYSEYTKAVQEYNKTQCGDYDAQSYDDLDEIQVKTKDKRLPNSIFEGDKITLKRVLSWLKNEKQISIHPTDSIRIRYLSKKVAFFNDWIIKHNKIYSEKTEELLRTVLLDDMEENGYLY